MVEAHHTLQHAQEEERHLLTESHQQLQDLESRRVDLIKKIVTAFLASYRLDWKIGLSAGCMSSCCRLHLWCPTSVADVAPEGFFASCCASIH